MAVTVEPPLGNIVVLVWSLLVTFHVVSVYERLNALLKIARLGEEGKAGGDELSVCVCVCVKSKSKGMRSLRCLTLTGNFSWL